MVLPYGNGRFDTNLFNSPLAAMLSFATEEIALRYVLTPFYIDEKIKLTLDSTGETIGGLLNASFGYVITLDLRCDVVLINLQ